MRVLVIGIIVAMITIGCRQPRNDRLNPSHVTDDTQRWNAETQSANYNIYAHRETVYIVASVIDRNIVIGNGTLFPKVKKRITLQKDGKGLSGIGLWADEDGLPPVKGDGFGSALAIHENDPIAFSGDLMEGGRAIVAVGAPSHDGTGAVFVFRIGKDGYGKEGLWWEAKVVPQNLSKGRRRYNQTLVGGEPSKGVGSEVNFITYNEETHLEILSQVGGTVLIPISVFLTVG